MPQLLSLFTLTACDQAAVKSYTIPKEQQAAAADELQYSVPAGWRQLPATGIRKATLQIEGAELSVLVFPGDVGGELANINRWREQIGLSPIEAGELPAISIERTISQLPARYVNLIGTEKVHQGAILPVNGRTWFLSYSDPLIAYKRMKLDYLSFLDSVQLPDTAY